MPDCPGCGIGLTGPQAAELRWIEGELGRVDAARSWLVRRRAVLLAELRQAATSPVRVPAAASVLAAEPALSAVPAPSAASSMSTPPAAEQPLLPLRPGRPASERRRPEMSGRTVARLLVGAGAALVVIAATAFTIADWGRVGPLVRCAILLGVTAIVLSAPRLLLRRSLSATAESVAAIGLSMTIADAYLLRQLIPGRPAGLLALAAACAVLAAAWTGYGRAAGLRGPALAALGLAQLPVPIAAAGIARVLGGSSYPLAGLLALAVVATCAADVTLTGWLTPAGALRPAVLSTSAWIAAITTWTAGIVLATAGLATAGLASTAGSSDTLWSAAALAAAAIIGIVLVPAKRAAWLPGAPVAILSGALLAAGLAVALAAALPDGWELAAAGAAGAIVSATTLALHRREAQRESPAGPALGQARRRLDLTSAGAAAVLGVAGLLSLPAAVAGLLPPRRLLPFWAGGHPSSGFAAVIAAGPQEHAAPIVLGLVSVACLLAPVPRKFAFRLAALICAALAAGCLPAAAGLSGWGALAVLTAAAAGLLGFSVLPGAGAASDAPTASEAGTGTGGDPRLAAVAAGCGAAVAGLAVLWALTGPAATIAELGVLAVILILAAALARGTAQAVIASTGAFAVTAGLAAAIALASGWPARYAAFGVLAVAVAGVAVATRLRRAYPVHALVLDLGAGPAVLIAGLMAARQANSFAALAATAALGASVTACLRGGRRQIVALAGAGCAAAAALVAERESLAPALFTPFRLLAQSWHGHDVAYVNAASSAGLPFAAVVLAVCLGAAVTAVGAWRGSGRGSLDAVAAALPLVAAPAGLAGGLGYGLTVGLLLALALALTGWAALGRSLAPAGAAIVAAVLALAWALAAPAPTLVVLGCLAAAYAACAMAARLPVIAITAAGLSTACATALAGCLVLAAGRPAWQAGLAMLAAAAAAHGIAWIIRSARAAIAVEITAWLAAAAGTVQCLNRPGPASLALAVAGLTCLSVAAARPDRRAAVWPGLVLCEVAWCVWLAAAGVRAPEPYTVPAAAIALGFGWHISRRQPELRSWLTYGLGLIWLLLPSLVLVWHSQGWIRPALLGLAAAAVTLAGAWRKLQAPLLIGAAVALLDAGHALAPAVLTLVHWLPGWVPIAVIGAILLWAGGTYEARLRNLGRLRRSLATLR